MVHRPPSVSFGTSAARTISASRTMLSALHTFRQARMGKYQELCCHDLQVPPVTSHCSANAPAAGCNLGCLTAALCTGMAHKLKVRWHLTHPSSTFCSLVFTAMAAPRIARHVADHKHPPEVGEVLGLLLRAAAARERRRGDGGRAPRAALVQEQHPEVLHRRLDPGGRLRRSRPLVPRPACDAMKSHLRSSSCCSHEKAMQVRIASCSAARD